MSSQLQTNDSGFSASGRFGRLSYLGWNMLLTVFVFILGIIAAIFIPAFDTSSTSSAIYILGGLFVIVYIAMIYFSFVFSIRRLHDRNQTGWLSLLMLIPLINFLFFIYLICAKGNPDSNTYGAPRITKGWEKVLAWIYIILLPLSIVFLAATAIPAYQSYVERSQQIQMQYQQYDAE
ncbi:DUF805 domain-containing protein [Acinetobacter haemolyticus]|uniref:DUF805 domain-containing protein n=1 Tax=Acinetobacter haemolyticus TaxID=29430 RepID=UPI000DEA81E5|nr:DUF805 domain-containing protein [Acinetobacter haemolyticus]WHR56626.1 DUF805 domain-containing protein [Acinetobacter haemolyticus]